MAIIDYVTYDIATGDLTGSYSQELQPEHENCYIIVTEAQRSDWTSYRANAARDGVELIPPVIAPPQIPQEVRSDQIAIASLDMGLWEQVKAYFDGLPVDAAGERARIRFRRRSTVRRDCDLVSDIATALSLTSGQVDAIFIAAALIG